MSLPTYERIVEAMRFAHTVDFTGWGEPLLHSFIYRMIRRAKDKGCVTSMTSNGTVLNESNCRTLIESGLDRLAVSIDGVRPETYEAIRRGARLQRTRGNLSLLSQLIKDAKASLELSVAFTVQEGNARDLCELVPWLRSVGVRVLHLKHLNAVSNVGDWERGFLKYRLAPQRGDTARLLQMEQGIDEVVRRAAEADVQVLLHSEHPLTAGLSGRHCLAAPLRAVYFSYEGRIAPCCHLGHHAARYFERDEHPPASFFLGDIRTQDLPEVWNSSAYAAFRRGFESGDFPIVCRNCYLLYGK
jgi:MoaA/NifB/PqqE/SkfB family radical SAM enzyme